MTDLPAVIDHAALVPQTPTTLTDRVQFIRDVLAKVMEKGKHYDVIPGCGAKPALLKAGAETLGAAFQLASSYKLRMRPLESGHREYEIICTLTNMPTGHHVGQGVGCCSTMESKYRWRGGKRLCPQCGKDAIIKGKAEYGGGWLCFAKKGGCGAKFGDKAKEIVDQQTDRTENPDIADTYNTVLKMAKKRALVDAMLTATGASAFFTQDVEEFAADLADATPDEPAPPPPPRTRTPRQPAPPKEPTPQDRADNVAGENPMLMSYGEVESLLREQATAGMAALTKAIDKVRTDVRAWPKGDQAKLVHLRETELIPTAKEIDAMANAETAGAKV